MGKIVKSKKLICNNKLTNFRLMATIGVLSVIISLLTIILSQKLFFRYKIFDKIISRSSHSVIATRNGGVAIFSSLFLITIYFYLNSNEIFDFSLMIPLGILFTIGLYDDFYQVDFKLKFIFQIIVAKILVDQGFYIESLNGFFGLYEMPYMAAQFISIFLIVLLINALNFSDGIDGLAITETIKGLILVICLSGVSIYEGINFLFLIIILSTIPLYYFNFRKKNKVFLGDSGSLLLGGIISIALIHLSNTIDYNEVGLGTPWLILICFAYPIVDLFHVVIKRTINKSSPFKADKGHAHHILLNKGFSHLRTLLIISLSTGIIQIISIYLFTN